MCLKCENRSRTTFFFESTVARTITMKSLLINGLTCQWARLWAQLHWYGSVIPPQKAINLLVILTILIANRICCDMPKHLNLMTFKILQNLEYISATLSCLSTLVLVTLRQLEIVTEFWEQRWGHQNNKRCFCLFPQIHVMAWASTVS